MLSTVLTWFKTIIAPKSFQLKHMVRERLKWDCHKSWHTAGLFPISLSGSRVGMWEKRELQVTVFLSMYFGGDRKRGGVNVFPIRQCKMGEGEGKATASSLLKGIDKMVRM